MRVLVTGAAGCIGRAVCAQLIKDGHRVYGLVRTEIPDGPWWAGVDWFYGDLGSANPDTLVKDADAVVHLAALVHRPSICDERAYRRENVENTRRLLGAALTAGIDPLRFVFSSSIGVNGRIGDRCGDENSRLQPHNAYTRSKLAADRMVREAGGVVLRFPLVYGAGDRGNVARMARAICSGWFLLPRHHLGRRSMLAAGNAAAAIARVLEQAHRGQGRVWVVCDQEPVRVDRLSRVIAEIAGVRAPRRVPDALLWAASWLGDVAATAGVSLPIDRHSLRKLTTDLEFSSSLIRSELGHRDLVTLEQGIAEMLESG